MKRYEKLEHLIFEHGDFVIRPPKSFKEIIDEGKKLSHCVGGYADRHSKGKCTLLFIRKTSEPNEPFYTVELNGTRIVQVRGNKNKVATKEVGRFMNQFKEVLEKPKEKVRKQA